MGFTSEELLAGRDRSGTWEGRNFIEAQANDEHGMRRYPAPAGEIPTGANEFHLGRVGKLEDLLYGALIKALGNFQEGMGTEILAVGGAPDGNVESFLFNLVRNLQRAEICSGGAAGNIDGAAIAISDDPCVRGD